jgi:D-aspartate ligase
MSSSQPPALVFGGDVTALAVLRALGRAGVETWVPGQGAPLVRRSHYHRAAPGAVDDAPNGERLAAYLDGLPWERTVLFPCTDNWAIALASLPERAAERHRAVVPPLSALHVLVDKAQFGEVTAVGGVPAPRTFRVRVPAELDPIPDEQLCGSFLKPIDSQRFAERFGVKGLRLDGRAQAAELLGQVAEAGHEVVIQEFIPGPPEAHVFLDGYVDRQGGMWGCLARRRLRMFPPPFGNSTLSETTPKEEVAPAIESLRQLFTALGFRGLFDAEFKRDERDGAFKVIEINGRPWWQLALAGASGLDVVGAAYRDAAGLPLPAAAEYRVGCRWVHPVPDARAWLATRGNPGRLGRFPLREWVAAEANAVFARDDPLPGLGELAGVPRGALKLGLRRVLGDRRPPLPTPAAAAEAAQPPPPLAS